MGYRSDVIAVFYNIVTGDEEKDKRNSAMLDMFVRENFPEALKNNEEEDEGLHRHEVRERVIWEFKYSSVKWYESYPEVVAFDAFWEKFCQLSDDSGEGGEPVDWACEFIRIGENTEDIEEKSSNEAEWLLQVNRVIETNY